MSNKISKRPRKERKLVDTQEPANIKPADQDKVLPPGSFIFPKEYVQGLMTSKLSDLEGRMIEEISRLKIWVLNLQTQLDAAHTEIDRLTQEDKKSKGLDKNSE